MGDSQSDATEIFFLTIQRQMVSELGQHDMGLQT
jgi:hypothetical protein